MKQLCNFLKDPWSTSERTQPINNHCGVPHWTSIVDGQVLEMSTGGGRTTECVTKLKAETNNQLAAALNLYSTCKFNAVQMFAPSRMYVL